jgi:hypothetical protein
MSPGDLWLEDATRISAHLEAIRRTLRKAIWAEVRQYPLALTPPQVHALQILVDQIREPACRYRS